MVYRITGVYRRRIDELVPYFPGALVVDDADETELQIRDDALGANANVRATPAGFYVHWWSARLDFAADLRAEGLDARELRNIVFSSVGRWTEDLWEREMHVDFDRETGDLTVGHYRLIAFAAVSRFSADQIRDGLEQIAFFRGQVEALVPDRLREAAARPDGKSPGIA